MAALLRKTTVITNGFTVSERSVADAEQDVIDWLKELGF